MVSSLSNLVNNLSEVIHKIKCKFEHDDKKYETCGIKYIAIVFLNTQILKMILQNKNVYVVTKIINKSLMKN